jgi:hypothetical protein
MKKFLRAIVFLAMLFVILYVGINNTKPVEFSLPLVWAKNIRTDAIWIYFAMFAVGVIAGLALGAGGEKPKAASSEGKKKG